MNIGVNGIGEVVLTLQAETAVKLGDLVTLKSNGLVQKAAADADPIGICVSRNGAYAGVQVKGGAVLPCTDSTLTVGYTPVKATAAGGIAKAAEGISRLVVAVDSSAKTAEILL